MAILFNFYNMCVESSNITLFFPEVNSKSCFEQTCRGKSSSASTVVGGTDSKAAVNFALN